MNNDTSSIDSIIRDFYQFYVFSYQVFIFHLFLSYTLLFIFTMNLIYEREFFKQR